MSLNIRWLACVVAMLVCIGVGACAQEDLAAGIYARWELEYSGRPGWTLPEPEGINSAPRTEEMQQDDAVLLAIRSVLENGDFAALDYDLGRFIPSVQFYETAELEMDLVPKDSRVWYIIFTNPDVEDNVVTNIVVVIDAPTGVMETLLIANNLV